MRISKEPAIQYDRVGGELTVTMDGHKHKLGRHGDSATAKKTAAQFIADQRKGKPE
jgi:hypothetical protein